METKHLLLAFFIALSLHSVAQQIPNAGFEDWSNYRVNEPDGYYPFNSRADSGNGNVTKVLDAYHGTLAARLETVLSNNDTVQGMMIIGRPGNQTIDGGIPFIGTPDSIIGYVKYDIKPTDLANIIIMFKKNGTVIAQAATTFTGTQTTYQRFSIPIHLAGLIPDTLAAVFSSSN